MDDATIIKAFGFIATLIAVLVPLFKLNGNIVKLTTVVEQLEKLIKENEGHDGNRKTAFIVGGII